MKELASFILETPSVSNDGYQLMNFVMEYYQGRTKELLKCEQYCNNIVAKFGSPKNDVDIRKTPVSSNDIDVKALEKEMADFFKVNSVRIYWQSGSDINAYTLVNSCITRYNAKKNLLDNKGTNMNINVFINTSVLTSAGLTGSELLAIILHEVGHNFTFCPVSAFMDVISWVLSFGITPIIQLIAKGVIIVKGELIDIIRKNIPFISNIIDVFNKWVLEYNYLMRPAVVINTISRIMSNPAETITRISNNANILKYGGEKAADSFAARYGYGNDLVTGLKKMDIPKYTMYGEIAHNTGVGRFIADITELQCIIISGLTLDPHPNTDQRAASLLKKLKKDLATGEYPNDVKKELEAEISKLETTYEAVNVINTRKDGVNIRKSIFDMINSATDNHSDLREIFNFYFNSYQF